jgi:hypothetical protein
MTQPTLFDLNEGNRLRVTGSILARDSRSELFAIARGLAVNLAREHGTVSYDDVYREMVASGMSPELMGNAAGSLFRGNEFQFTGQWKRSERISNHARVIRVWRLAQK